MKDQIKNDGPRPGPAGTADQWPRWEGDQDVRPRGYLPAKDNPETAPDALEEGADSQNRKA